MTQTGGAGAITAPGAKVNVGPAGAGAATATGMQMQNNGKGGSTVVVPGVGAITTPPH